MTKVDVAWHPAWENTEQRRFFELSGCSRPRCSNIRRILVGCTGGFSLGRVSAECSISARVQKSPDCRGTYAVSIAGELL